MSARRIGIYVLFLAVVGGYVAADEVVLRAAVQADGALNCPLEVGDPEGDCRDMEDWLETHPPFGECLDYCDYIPSCNPSAVYCWVDEEYCDDPEEPEGWLCSCLCVYS